MINELEKLHARLQQAAYRAWDDACEYQFDNEGSADFDKAHLDELVQREFILFDALKEVTTAVKVVRILQGDRK